MTNECVFSIGTTRFNEDYTPSTNSRGTTNFANLARGEHRRKQLLLIHSRLRFQRSAPGAPSDGNPQRLRLSARTGLSAFC
ncbi:putative oxygenase MesX [Rhodococcus sp. NPDC060086]|uniref:putative oxygenase MesX n=1 Tax=Rhodococcus sp. NPDC060086 TaxID=3347055 RepID=UPI003653FD29